MGWLGGIANGRRAEPFRLFKLLTEVQSTNTFSTIFPKRAPLIPSESTIPFQTDGIELEKDIYFLALIGLFFCFCRAPDDKNWSPEVQAKAHVVNHRPGLWAAYAIQAYTLLLLSLLAQFSIVYWLWHHAHYNVKIEEIDTDGYLRVVANVVFFCIMAGEARVTHQMWQYIHGSEKLKEYKIFVRVVIVVLWLPKLIVAVSL